MEGPQIPPWRVTGLMPAKLISHVYVESPSTRFAATNSQSDSKRPNAQGRGGQSQTASPLNLFLRSYLWDSDSIPD